MCISPVTIYTDDGAQPVACRECWQCRQNKITDFVGRNIAESKTSKASHAFTLTYGTDEEGSADHIHARILMYSDVQKFFKKLRSAGYPCRYFVVGEYGETKGRAHWHGLIYWKDRVPDIPLRKERTYSIEQWEHGYSFFDNPSMEAIRYACKYISKDMHKGGRQGVCWYSRMPPLGWGYFKDMAEQYVRAGKAPRSLEYSFPGIERRKRGSREKETIRFRMVGRTAEMFIDHFIDTWREQRPGEWLPAAEAVEERMDHLARQEIENRRGPKVQPVDKNSPGMVEQAKRYKSWALWHELRYNGELMDEIAEQNYVLHTLMKTKEQGE